MGILILLRWLLIHNCDIKGFAEKVKDLVGMGLVGCFLYMISLKLSLKIRGVALTSYKGFDHVGKIPMSDYFPMIKRSYERFFNFFGFTEGIEFFYITPLLKVMYICALLLIVIIFIWYIIKQIKKRRYFSAVISTVLLLLFPLGINYVDAIVKGTTSNTIMIYQFVLVFIFFIVLVEDFLFDTEQETTRYFLFIPRFINIACVIISLITAYNYILIDNIYYLKLHVCYERTYGLVNRLVERIEAIPEYMPEDTPIVVIGTLPNINYPNSEYMFDEIKNDVGVWNSQYIGTSYKYEL